MQNHKWLLNKYDIFLIFYGLSSFVPKCIFIVQRFLFSNPLYLYFQFRSDFIKTCFSPTLFRIYFWFRFFWFLHFWAFLCRVFGQVFKPGFVNFFGGFFTRLWIIRVMVGFSRFRSLLILDPKYSFTPWNIF